MTQDLNKGISDIQYNLLNLPKQMDVKNPLGESRREYTYSAGGQKLKVIERWNPNFQTVPQIGSGVTPSSLTSSITTDYVANKVYENGSLKRTLIPGGYIEGGQYLFFLTDHLGSTHLLAYKEAMVYQQVNYYPFGMAFADGVAQDVQPYKFTGKELDNKHKIGIYDSHARMQDTQIPRFLSIDPLAEKYYSWSPYVYCANNPMRYIDLRGDSITFIGDIELQKRTEILINNGIGLNAASIDKNGNTNISILNDEQLSLLTSEQKAFYSMIKNGVEANGNVKISLVDNSEDVLIGSYKNEQIDIADIESFGVGKGANMYSTFGHEVAEQQQKQLNINSIKGSYSISHYFGMKMEDAISGYFRGISNTKGVTFDKQGRMSGTLIVPFSKYAKELETIKITILLNSNNITNVTR